MNETERLLTLIDALRDSIASGTPTLYLFAWTHAPVPVEAAPGRMPEAAGVPFAAPPADGVVHLLLTWGPDLAKVVAAHARVSEPYTIAATTPG